MRLLLIALLSLFVLPAWAQKAGVPGKFDHYVLSLSWSPTYCGGRAGREDDQQCGGPRRYGFIVHGLWPQYDDGGYPAQCVANPAPVPEDVAKSVLDIMPSRKLIDHEWDRHGTCDGSSAAAYYDKTRKAFETVRIPGEFTAPQGPLDLPPDQVEALFARINPGLTGDAMAVVCRGRYAAEVRVCLDKDLKFTACSRSVRDRCAGKAMFPPVR